MTTRRDYAHCSVADCRVFGGRVYVEAHQRLEHCRCSCGWVGALRSFNHHLGQRRRFDDDQGHELLWRWQIGD